MLGIRGDTRVADDPSAATTPLATRVPREAVVYLNGVYLTEARQGPVNVIAWWAKNADGTWILHAVMTNLPATWRTYLHGRRRMWIETIFRDWQSQGFDLDACGVTEPDRFSRLLLALSLAYLWIVSIGRYVVTKGWRRRIDDGPSYAWRYSLFQLGLGWRDHLSRCGKSLPVLFYLYW